MEEKKIKAALLSPKRVVKLQGDGINLEVIIEQTLFFWKGSNEESVIGTFRTSLGDIDLPFSRSIFNENFLADYPVKKEEQPKSKKR